MVDVCGLCDIDYYGRSWTFEKKVAGGTFCQVRLDRALATTDWSARFPLARVCNMSAVASDHGPIILRWQEEEVKRHQNGRFKYEVMWETHNNF
jgi:hypothetical protein